MLSVNVINIGQVLSPLSVGSFNIEMRVHLPLTRQHDAELLSAVR